MNNYAVQAANAEKAMDEMMKSGSWINMLPEELRDAEWSILEEQMPSGITKEGWGGDLNQEGLGG